MTRDALLAAAEEGHLIAEVALLGQLQYSQNQRLGMIIQALNAQQGTLSYMAMDEPNRRRLEHRGATRGARAHDVPGRWRGPHRERQVEPWNSTTSWPRSATTFLVRSRVGSALRKASRCLFSTRAIPLVVALGAIMAMARQTFPVGALVQAFLTLGIAKAAIQFWPDIVSGTTAQINAFASVLGVDGADPFEVIAAGGALASLAFNHADAAAGYFSGWITSIFYFLAGIVIIICYAVISGLSLLAWVEFWAAAIILFPLVAMLGIAGFSQAAFVPISFLLSSTMRIAAIAMIAGYGSDLMAEYALPDMTDTVTWLNGFAAIILAGVLCLLTYGCNRLILSILMGRPGFTIGAATLLEHDLRGRVYGGEPRFRCCGQQWRWRCRWSNDVQSRQWWWWAGGRPRRCESYPGELEDHDAMRFLRRHGSGMISLSPGEAIGYSIGRGLARLIFLVLDLIWTVLKIGYRAAVWALYRYRMRRLVRAADNVIQLAVRRRDEERG